MNSQLRRFFWLSTFLIFLLGMSTELTDQEAYYWTWSTQPAWGYYEHPPLQAWITHFFCMLFGDHTWVVRLPALLGRCASFAIFLTWVHRSWGPTVARLAAWLLLGSFFFNAGSFISLPDSVMLPFALLAMKSADERRPFLAGMSLGLAGLGKWTAALLAPGVLWAFLAQPDLPLKRRLARSAFVGFLALALQTPVLYWNSQHEWASFLFHLSQRHEHGPLPFWTAIKNASQFGAAQLLVGGLSLLILLFFFFTTRARKSPTPSRSTGSHVPLLWWILPTFGVFGLSALRGESRFYWTSLAFPALFVFFARKAATWPPSLKLLFERLQSRALMTSLFLIALVLWLPVGAYLKPLTDLYKPYDLRHSPRGDLKGWREWIVKDLEPHGLLAPDVAFLTTDFRLAAQVAWGAKFHDMSRVGTVNHQSQFQFWVRPHPSRYKRAVFVGDNRRSPGPIFGLYCQNSLPEWQTHTIFLLGKPIKEIYWTVCDHFQWAPDYTKNWRF